jgi:hypothetical protein
MPRSACLYFLYMSKKLRLRYCVEQCLKRVERGKAFRVAVPGIIDVLDAGQQFVLLVGRQARDACEAFPGHSIVASFAQSSVLRQPARQQARHNFVELKLGDHRRFPPRFGWRRTRNCGSQAHGALRWVPHNGPWMVWIEPPMTRADSAMLNRVRVVWPA